jgi:hypothetical protein
MKIFNSKPIIKHLQELNAGLVSQVNQLSEEAIVGDDVVSLSERVLIGFKQDTLEINFDRQSIETTTSMEQVPGSSFTFEYFVEKNKYYSCANVCYYFKFKGSSNLLNLSPFGRSLSQAYDVKINGNSFSICYQTLYSNEDLNEDIKNQIKVFIRNFVDESKFIQEQLNKELIEYYNSRLNTVKQLILERKSEIVNAKKRDNDLLDF